MDVSSNGANRPPSRLHGWAMWRMSVNKELIHCLHGSLPGPEHSTTKRYIDNPQASQNHSRFVRTEYGMPSSKRNPIGDNLYFMYGLPRVSACFNVPEVMSAHYDSMPNVSMLKSQPQRSAPTLDRDIYLRKPQVQREMPSSNNEYVNLRQINSESKPMTYLDRVEELHGDKRCPSPVNFRDKLEVEYQGENSPPLSGEPYASNFIFKPAVVPPVFFQKEIFRRSNELRGIHNGVVPEDETLGNLQNLQYQNHMQYMQREIKDNLQDLRYVNDSRMKTQL